MIGSADVMSSSASADPPGHAHYIYRTMTSWTWSANMSTKKLIKASKTWKWVRWPMNFIIAIT